MKNYNGELGKFATKARECFLSIIQVNGKIGMEKVPSDSSSQVNATQNVDVSLWDIHPMKLLTILLSSLPRDFTGQD